MAKKLAELYSSVFERQLVSDGLEYLAKEVSKQCVQGVAWFFLSTYSKKHKERDKLKELLSKKRSRT